MATNTVKALSEDHAKKVKELREINLQLDQKPGDAELSKRFDSADSELRAISSGPQSMHKAHAA